LQNGIDKVTLLNALKTSQIFTKQNAKIACEQAKAKA